MFARFASIWDVAASHDSGDLHRPFDVVEDVSALIERVEDVANAKRELLHAVQHSIADRPAKLRELVLERTRSCSRENLQNVRSGIGAGQVVLVRGTGILLGLRHAAQRVVEPYVADQPRHERQGTTAS